ncbi:hypothetical protein Z517_09233 [Fonsecaea pedrosoi CBS 271.37]|uniref:Uncharacterized protein n=1 Tax=Fonsecaea pedrosoi CBS 271.37 TaxID=1442368 RepID=A0A0D2GWP7_9EURO|nr:uncharacterized protein Z517_09233 [Fonsecaea pedrosoi CBS 271.37]KIW76789.1 hypothetical protein Z517_09233 [Fonsecaea pedrosoi CBS 271.37]
MTNEATPLLPKWHNATNGNAVNDNVSKDTLPGRIPSGILRHYHLYCHRLSLFSSALRLTLRLLRGKDKRLDRDTVWELRWIAWYFSLATVSAVLQAYILPKFNLSVYAKFAISVGVSELVNSFVELGISRHVRAVGAALTTHIFEHVFGWVGEKSEETSRRRCLALVKESLRKSDGLGNFLFAATKGLQVSVSVLVGMCCAVWSRLGVWSFPLSVFVTWVFVGGLAVTQWSLSWKNTESLNEARSTLNQEIIQRQAQSSQAEAASNLEAGRNIDGSLDAEAALGLATVHKLVADHDLSTSLKNYLKLAQRQAVIEVVRRHLLQVLVFAVLAFTHDISLCVRLWRDCQALDGVFQKFINSIAQQSVVREATTLDQALLSLNQGYKFMEKAECTFWEEVRCETWEILRQMGVGVCSRSRRLLSRRGPPRQPRSGYGAVGVLRRSLTI